MSLVLSTWICLSAPAVAAFVSRVSRLKSIYWLNIAAVLVACLASLSMLINLDSAFVDIYAYTWLSAGVSFDFGFWIDPLSIYMAVIVTLVSLFVHVYSIGYMKDDQNINRYFSYVSMFTSAMLLLVFSDNLLLMFFGWEGVGVFSYLLIGFWHQKSYPNTASLKAFIVNRIADIAMVIGMVLLLMKFGTLNYNVLTQTQTSLTQIAFYGLSWADLVGICLLIGAMGKSAQMPLHVWLPDSMAGPTPISALIHAATMVTAGVYLVCRLSWLFALAPFANEIMLVIAAAQMLMMGALALVEYDIKRIVAFSTLSQLGMMLASCALGGYAQAMFHLGTHAFFKSLLFLVCGAIIIASKHEQDIRYTADMRSNLLVKFAMLFGCLNLSGLPPFSGFFSKDMIVERIFAASSDFGWAGQFANIMMGAAVVMTALYAARLYIVTCHTEKKSASEQFIPLSMQSILAVLSVTAVFCAIGLRAYLPTMATVLKLPCGADGCLDPAALVTPALVMLQESFTHAALYGVVLGWVVAYVSLVSKPGISNQLIVRFNGLYRILLAQYGFNQFNDWVIVPAYTKLAYLFANKIDIRLIDRQMVLKIPTLILNVSQSLRSTHQGRLYEYAAWMFVAMMVLIAILA